MELDRKTEIVTEYIVTKALEELKKEYGQEIPVSLKADFKNGSIFIKVMS